MAIPQVQISGKVLRPDGVGAPGGEVFITLAFPGTVRDPVGNVDHRIGGMQRFVIGIDGSVSGITLVPNESISPAGSFYTVTFKFQNGVSWYELWQLSNTTPIGIGDVPLLGAQQIGTELVIPMRPAFPITPASASLRGHVYLIPGGIGEEDKTYVVLKGTDEIYRSKPLVYGGGPD